MRTIPFQSEQSPLLILDLLYKLRIRDVMSENLITLPRSASMYDAQMLMKQQRVSGVPIVENRRLYGLVSIDDIIRALEGGYIRDPVTAHMSTSVVTLEEDMPVSMAISYFGKYPYGRFPVLNQTNEPVGIVTHRSINTSILLKLFDELNKLEAREFSEHSADGLWVRRTYHVNQYDFENAGKASSEIRRMLMEKRLDAKLVRRVAVASYELEVNLVAHSIGGTLAFVVTPEKIEITAQDLGPGIEDVDLAVQEGWTTANEWIKSMGFGAGLGLANVKRVSDDFYIQSAQGVGTMVKSVIRLTPPAAPATEGEQKAEVSNATG